MHNIRMFFVGTWGCYYSEHGDVVISQVLSSLLLKDNVYTPKSVPSVPHQLQSHPAVPDTTPER